MLPTVSIMLISASPVTAAARMLNTNFYLILSRRQAGGLFKADVTVAIPTAMKGNHISQTSTKIAAYTSMF